MASPREPGERPNRTPLDRAPGERYRPALEPDAGRTAERPASPARGIAWAVIVAIGGAALIVAFGGPLAVSLGLVVLAVLIGRFVTLVLLAGGGAAIAPGRRATLAVAIAVLGVLLGQFGIWLYARSEGGVLGLVDYLGQAFGWLVPVQVVVAAAVARWTAR